ncbi:MAG: ABC transporter permease [Ignavibacteriales bacterium]
MNMELFKALLKRLISSLIVLFISISIIFLLIRVSPGDPAQKFLGPGLSPRLLENVKASYSLNNSLSEQYFYFVKNFLSLNLGVSYTYRLPVLSVIAEYLPFTLLFSLLSFLIQIFCSIVLVIFAGKYRGRIIDHLISRSFLALYSVPAFLIGLGLIYIFSVKLNMLPSSDLRSPEVQGQILSQIWDIVSHLILPLLTLSLPGLAIFYTYLRDNTEEIYNKPFITYLRSMGVSEKTILKKHIIPNAISPLISVAGIELGLLFSGAFITEVIFSLPGLGRLTMNAVFSRDYPLIIGCTFVSGLLILITNLAADFIKFRIDKRYLKGIFN